MPSYCLYGGLLLKSFVSLLLAFISLGSSNQRLWFNQVVGCGMNLISFHRSLFFCLIMAAITVLIFGRSLGGLLQILFQAVSAFPLSTFLGYSSQNKLNLVGVINESDEDVFLLFVLLVLLYGGFSVYGFSVYGFPVCG